MPIGHADLHPGAAVYSSDGRHVGELEFMLVDGEGMDLRQIVVKESAIASGHHWWDGGNSLVQDVLVPAESITSATAERVELGLSLSAVRHLPPYLSYKYAGGSAARLGGGLLGWPTGVYAEEARKPAGELEIEKDENVMFRHSGEVLGQVHDLVYDNGELVGIVVRPHKWAARDVLLQVRFLDRSDDGALFAHISEEDLEHLKKFEEG